jgi:hypothetical protein
MCVYVNLSRYIHVCVCACVRMDIYIYIYIYIYTYIHIHIFRVVLHSYHILQGHAMILDASVMTLFECQMCSLCRSDVCIHVCVTECEQETNQVK